jgi:hypothetical protein
MTLIKQSQILYQVSVQISAKESTAELLYMVLVVQTFINIEFSNKVLMCNIVKNLKDKLLKQMDRNDQ